MKYQNILKEDYVRLNLKIFLSYFLIESQEYSLQTVAYIVHRTLRGFRNSCTKTFGKYPGKRM